VFAQTPPERAPYSPQNLLTTRCSSPKIIVKRGDGTDCFLHRLSSYDDVKFKRRLVATLHSPLSTPLVLAVSSHANVVQPDLGDNYPSEAHPRCAAICGEHYCRVQGKNCSTPPEPHPFGGGGGAPAIPAAARVWHPLKMNRIVNRHLGGASNNGEADGAEYCGIEQKRPCGQPRS
jgi:hypothetical protein